MIAVSLGGIERSIVITLIAMSIRMQGHHKAIEGTDNRRARLVQDRSGLAVLIQPNTAILLGSKEGTDEQRGLENESRNFFFLLGLLFLFGLFLRSFLGSFLLFCCLTLCGLILLIGLLLSLLFLIGNSLVFRILLLSKHMLGFLYGTDAHRLRELLTEILCYKLVESDTVSTLTCLILLKEGFDVITVHLTLIVLTLEVAHDMILTILLTLLGLDELPTLMRHIGTLGKHILRVVKVIPLGSLLLAVRLLGMSLFLSINMLFGRLFNLIFVRRFQFRELLKHLLQKTDKVSQ